MAALCVGAQFGVGLDQAIAAIEAYSPSNNRSQMTRTGKNTLIVDAYNANPSSMDAALTNFSNVEADHKIVMLGDMLELGEDSLTEHLNVINRVAGMELDKVYLVGKEFASALSVLQESAHKIMHFNTSDELAVWVDKEGIADSVVLIKGSRGTRMEKVIEKL